MVHLSTKRVKMTKLQTYRFEIKFNFVTPLVDASAVFVYIGSNFFSVEFALDGECGPDLLSGAYSFANLKRFPP